MPGSIKIDTVILNGMYFGRDSCRIKYFDINKYKEGGNTSPKNCYTNPFDTFICLFTDLGCYLYMNDETWKGGDQKNSYKLWV